MSVLLQLRRARGPLAPRVRRRLLARAVRVGRRMLVDGCDQEIALLAIEVRRCLRARVKVRRDSIRVRQRWFAIELAAAERAEPGGGPRTLAALEWLARSHLHFGRHERFGNANAHAFSMRALALSERLHGATSEQTLRCLSLAKSGADPATRASLSERALAVAEAVHGVESEAFVRALIDRAETLADEGRLSEAVAHLERADEIADDDLRAYLLILLPLAAAYARADRFEDSIATHRRHLAIADGRSARAVASAFLAEALLQAGRPDEALGAIDDALRSMSSAWMHVTRSRALRALGRTHESVEAARLAVRLSRKVGRFFAAQFAKVVADLVRQ